MLVMISALQIVIAGLPGKTFFGKKLPERSKNIALFQSGRRIILDKALFIKYRHAQKTGFLQLSAQVFFGKK